MSNNEDKRVYVAKTLINAIDNLDRTILMYDIEKEVVKEALRDYIEKLEGESNW